MYELHPIGLAPRARCIPVLWCAGNRFGLNGVSARGFVMRAQLQISDGEARGVLVGGVSRSKRPAGCPPASASRWWADGLAACKRVAAVEDTPRRPSVMDQDEARTTMLAS